MDTANPYPINTVSLVPLQEAAKTQTEIVATMAIITALGGVVDTTSFKNDFGVMKFKVMIPDNKLQTYSSIRGLPVI